jgi:hypothetical protein
MTNIKAKIILIILVVAAFVATGLYFGYQKFYFSRAPEVPAEEPKEEIKPPAENLPAKNSGEISAGPAQPKSEMLKIFPGFKIYKNAEFGFEMQYPEAWQVSEEPIENVRGEQTKAIYFKKPNSDLRFAVLPRDGLSYGLPNGGSTSRVNIGGSMGVQSKWTLEDGRRLWLVHPQYGLFNWSQDIGRIDTQTSAADPAGDTVNFETMLNSFRFLNNL